MLDENIEDNVTIEDNITDENKNSSNTLSIENVEYVLLDNEGKSISGNICLNINNIEYKNDNYIPIEGLEIELYKAQNLNFPLDKIIPDSKGFYEFTNLDLDDYILKLNLPNNYTLIYEEDEYFKNKNLLISNKINNKEKINIPINLKKLFCVKGVIFLDKSNTGIYNKESIGINGIKISLLDENDNVIKETKSRKFLSIDGLFEFDNLESSTYKITINIEDGIDFSVPRYNLEFGSKAAKIFSGIKCIISDHDLLNAYIGLVYIN